MIHQMKKSELIHALKSLGETPPEQWTVPELRTRLMEAEEEKGIIRTKGRKMTDLQHWVCRLNKCQKKPQLIAFCGETLRIHLSGNETVETLHKKGMEKILEISIADKTDPLGFGIHSALTYQEVAIHYESYAMWTVATMKEGQCSVRLARFAQWYEEKGKSLATEYHEAISKGKDVVEVPLPKTSEDKTKEASSASSGSTAPRQMMKEMMEMLGALKEEMADLRDERPRKKDQKSVVIPNGTEGLPTHQRG